GIDVDGCGQRVITVCGIPHMCHLIGGDRYLREEGQHFDRYTSNDITESGDHVHWVGDRGPHAGNFRSNAAGGGHAHSGAMIYLGNENWPEEYRSKIYMNNIHGARINVDKLARRGSGYVASHEDDFILT